MSCEIKNPTNNPLCSDSIKDLKDNAIIMDQYINSQELEVEDRLGEKRKTWAGIEKDADSLEPRMEQLIDDKIIAQGGVEIVNEWGDSPDKVLSQEFLSKSKIKVNVVDFGAVADGVTDSTQAFLDAIDYCRDVGAALTLPKGVLKVNPDTIDPLGVSIEGVGGGYFNRFGSIIESITGSGTILKQNNFRIANITFSLSNILFRKCGDAFDLGYAVNCNFDNLFLEESTGSFRLGRPDVLGSLWCSFRNCQTNTDGAGLILDGSTMANSNYFEACAFRGKQPSKIHASGGYGAIGNTFIATEFLGSGIGLELGHNRNTNMISCYFESTNHSVNIASMTRGLSLTNPIFSVHESIDGNHPTYVKHSNGVLDISITNPIVFVTDKDTTKGMSLFRSYADAYVRRVSITNPIINVSGGTEQSLDFKLVRGVSISKLKGGFKEGFSTSETGMTSELTYMCGDLTTVRGRIDIVDHSKTDLFEINLQDTYSEPAHSVVGDCLVRNAGSDSAMLCRLSSSRNRLYITKPNGQHLMWEGLAANDFIYLNVQLT